MSIRYILSKSATLKIDQYLPYSNSVSWKHRTLILFSSLLVILDESLKEGRTNPYSPVGLQLIEETSNEAKHSNGIPCIRSSHGIGWFEGIKCFCNPVLKGKKKIKKLKPRIKSKICWCCKSNEYWMIWKLFGFYIKTVVPCSLFQPYYANNQPASFLASCQFDF